ncbi:MAG: polysaccharide biosynthesis tyrosine autokinase, partial [Planctomycetes bacterium]|nr:polysaccharide biosynthesis tyrosine autokinase [Planctomycetota bacterium]
YLPNPQVVSTAEVSASRRALNSLNRQRAERLQAYTEEDQGVKRIDADKELELQNYRRVLGDAFQARELEIATKRVRAEARVKRIDQEIALLETNLELSQLERRRMQDMALLYREAKFEVAAASDRLMQEELKIKGYEAQLAEQSGVLLPQNFSTAAIPTASRDNRWQVSVVVGLIILVGSSVVIYVMMLARNKISSEYDVRRHVNLPVLAKMAKRPDNEKSLLTISPRSAAAEAYSTLATQVRAYARELSLRSILVTSAVKSEGKTDVTCNLLIALARKGLSVLVIDADLHRPGVAFFFGVTPSSGLLHYAQSPEGADVIDYVMPTYAGGPDLLLPGGEVQDPVRLLESDAFKAMLKQAEREYDIVLFDSPPVARVGDALIVGSEVDATLMVCCAGEVSFADAALAKRLLTNVQANLLGVVLNNSTDVSAREYYNYYSYGDRTRRSVRKVFD